MNAPWPFWRRYLNLAQPRMGARIIEVSDDFFGAAHRLLEPADPVFAVGKYDEHGKWMDGWESRRRRDDNHDWCIIELGAPARFFGVDIDTSHFNGNQPQSASIEAAHCASDATPRPGDWFDLLPSIDLQATSQHRRPVAVSTPATHLRLNIFPDGGVARLRAYGLAEHDWVERDSTQSEQLIDLVAAQNGGSVVAANNEHFGAASNLLLPGRGVNMGDGWETARRRGPGHDWAILKLGCPGTIQRVEIDTAHFKGNFPDQCALYAALHPTLNAEEPQDPTRQQEEQWTELISRQSMQADHQHLFELPETGNTIFSHVKLEMFPDGGVSRLRILGQAKPTKTSSSSTGDQPR